MVGGILVVGAPAGENSPGVAHVFLREGHRWQHRQTLQGSDVANDGGHFGSPVAINRQAILVTGSSLVADSSVGPVNLSAVYVFLRHGHWWSESQKLQAGSGDLPITSFGTAIAASRNRGAISTPVPMGPAPGYVDIYEWQGVYLNKTAIEVSGVDASFGSSLDLYGSTVIANQYLERVHFYKAGY